MDGTRFDRLARALAAASSRRRLVGTLGLLAGGLLGREAAAQEVGGETCRERLGNCDRRDQCCEAQQGHRVRCGRVSEECRSPQDFPGERCCGGRGSICADSCACCEGYVCRQGRCVSLERVCLENVCCTCFRCDDNNCQPLRCLTADRFRGCIERCPDADAIEGVSGRGTTFACRENGGCRVTCEDRRGEGRSPTVERWGVSAG